jgi:ABC-type oligopeptide transport system ATPase subunit
LRLERETAGRIVYDGIDVTSATADELKRYRRSIQVIFRIPIRRSIRE